MDNEELAHTAYKMWITAYYGTYPAANIKLWEQLPDKTQGAWIAVVEMVRSHEDHSDKDKN
jgi:hypothetical protein